MSRQEKQQKSDIGSTISLWGVASEIGYKLSIPLLVLMLAGIYLDKKLNIAPLFTILGIILALGSSTYMIYDMIKRVNKSEDKQK